MALGVGSGRAHARGVAVARLGRTRAGTVDIGRRPLREQRRTTPLVQQYAYTAIHGHVRGGPALWPLHAERIVRAVARLLEIGRAYVAGQAGHPRCTGRDRMLAFRPGPGGAR